MKKPGISAIILLQQILKVLFNKQKKEKNSAQKTRFKGNSQIISKSIAYQLMTNKIINWICFRFKFES